MLEDVLERENLIGLLGMQYFNFLDFDSPPLILYLSYSPNKLSFSSPWYIVIVEINKTSSLYNNKIKIKNKQNKNQLLLLSFRHVNLRQNTAKQCCQLNIQIGCFSNYTFFRYKIGLHIF